MAIKVANAIGVLVTVLLLLSPGRSARGCSAPRDGRHGAVSGAVAEGRSPGREVLDGVLCCSADCS